MKKLARYLVCTVAVVLLLSVVALAESPTKVVKRVVATVGQDGIQRAEILGGGYFYDPNHLVVKVNVPVELTLKKDAGFTPHDIVMNAPEAGIVFSEIMDTKPKVVRFTPTKAGTYPFYCTKKMIFMSSHREKGMEGVLEVQ